MMFYSVLRSPIHHLHELIYPAEQPKVVAHPKERGCCEKFHSAGRVNAYFNKIMTLKYTSGLNQPGCPVRGCKIEPARNDSKDIREIIREMQD